MMNRRRFLSIAAVAMVAGPARAETTRWRGFALGAEAEITLRGSTMQAKKALIAAQQAMSRAEALFSLHRPDSTLSKLNRRGASEVPDTFLELLHLCDRLHKATGGCFDPTVQPLWHALANGTDAVAARALIGWDRVDLSPSVRLGARQAMTLNGIAQGMATDMVTEALADHGFSEALVNIGEFRAGDGDWRIGVSDPVEGLIRTTTLTGGAIATSSPSATLVEGQPHIFGPDGTPPRWSTISVEAETAALADGLSTALCLARADQIEPIAARFPEVTRITAVQPGGDFRVFSF